MFGQRLTFALYVTVIGLAVVFLVLVVLILCTKLIPLANKIPSREDMKNKRKAKKAEMLEAKAAEPEKVAEPQAPAVVPAPAAVTAEVTGDELQAVIAAAIAAYMADMPCAVNPNGIVVRSVRRAGGFNAASRYERMNNRI
ncbi:MAG: OadG family protein [Christensenellaceae bacterium]|nr:OadG family protein [Christensenellaceae bacterium]